MSSTATISQVLSTAHDSSVSLSFGQERLWLLQQLNPSSSAYNIPVALRFRDGVDFPALERVLSALVARHPVLCWTYVASETGGAVAKPVLNFSIPVTQRESGPGHDDWRVHADELVAEPFDLAAAPPVRARVIECPDGSAVLCMVLHHLIIDARSIEILSKEIASLYQSKTLSPLVATYGEFVEWQRSTINENSIAEHIEYWRQELDGFERLDLPSDRPRAIDPGFAGDDVDFHLPIELTDKLEAFAVRHRCSFTSVVAAVFQALLSIQSGQEDITIGAILGGRENRRFSDVFGFFANTVVLRNRVDSSISFRELLKEAQRKVANAHSHQQAPFDQVVTAVQPERKPGHNAIFDIAFTHAGEFPEIGDGTISREAWNRVGTQFDLELFTFLQNGQLHGTLGFRTSLFDRPTAILFADRFVQLVEEALKNPDEPIINLNLITQSEIARSEARWSASARPIATGSLVSLFEDQVAKTPSRVAVIDTEGQFTYAEINGRANQLANRLISVGAGPDQVIGVIAERGPRLIIAFLAILKVGAAYLPLSTGDPSERHRLLLGEAGARLLLSDQFRKVEGHVVVDIDADEFTTESPSINVHPDQLAYVMYTSGSSGLPKAVAIAHRQVAELALDRRWSGIVDRVLHHSNHTFDAATFEIWVPLLSGGSIVVAPPGRLDVSTLERLIHDESVSFVFITEGLFRVFAEERPQVFDGVKEVWTGGDVVSPKAVANVLKHCPNLVIANVYGPTEATTFATAHRIRQLELMAGLIPIGTPLDNTRCYVLDHNLRPMPEGVIGELFIAGTGIGRGYLFRPDQTARRFVADPYGPPGSRMYRSGDLARWRTDGVLEFSGRADDQVKIRGYRVEPGEIEYALASLPHINQAAVVARRENADTILVAYVVVSPHTQVSEADLRQSLGENLPDYMVPSAFVTLDSLPITENGKLDRKALPVPIRESSASGRAPSNKVEETLCELFSEALGLQTVSVDDNFFELGGHSLLATSLVGRIKSSLGIELSMGDLFQAQSVAQLSALIENSNPSGNEAVLLPIRTEGIKPPVFFFHPGVGLSWCYVGFTKYLRDIPIYGLQARAVSNNKMRAVSLREMAQDYIEQIRRVYPDGPFRLVGWSFGANVAHTVAAMLQASGAKVELLALIDGYPYAGNPPGAKGLDLREETENLDTVRQLHLKGDDLSSVDDQRASELAAVLAHNKSLAEKHNPPSFDGDVLFFRAIGHPDIDELKPFAWHRYITGSLREHPIAAEHYDMMQPNPLAQIAGVLVEELASAGH